MWAGLSAQQKQEFINRLMLGGPVSVPTIEAIDAVHTDTHRQTDTHTHTHTHACTCTNVHLSLAHMFILALCCTSLRLSQFFHLWPLIDQAYHLSENQNSEIALRWQQLCLQAGWAPIFPHVVKFITSQVSVHRIA